LDINNTPTAYDSFACPLSVQFSFFEANILLREHTFYLVIDFSKHKTSLRARPFVAKIPRSHDLKLSLWLISIKRALQRYIERKTEKRKKSKKQKIKWRTKQRIRNNYNTLVRTRTEAKEKSRWWHWSYGHDDWFGLVQICPIPGTHAAHWPSWWFCAAQFKVSFLCMYNIMATCSYFDNLKLDVFDAVSSVPLYHVWMAFRQISSCPLRCKLISSLLISVLRVPLAL